MYIVTYPDTDPENLGYDIDLSGAQLSQVAHMDTVVIHPLYRGQSLQRKLTLFLEQEPIARWSGILCARSHPDNKYSRNNMEKCGYQVMKTAFKYGGLLRLIFLKTATQR